ncbi:MAG: winged helix-turn-helix domain-containing protein, partial [Verrucomicrobiaceae bacterium]
MREINKFHVLEAIRHHGQISRVEISERTLLSGTTVSAITGALIEEGLIHAIHTPSNGETQRGRPRVLLGLVPDAAYVLGIKISESLT